MLIIKIIITIEIFAINVIKVNGYLNRNSLNIKEMVFLNFIKLILKVNKNKNNKNINQTIWISILDFIR